MRKVKPLDERLWARIDADGPCWLWTGAKHRNGYGAINRGRRGLGTAVVHRFVWELLVGPVPEGMDLDHLCRVRECCNPDHLQPVSRPDNVARGAYRAGAPRAFRCDHPETPANTVRTGRQRTCRTCKNEANRRYRARMKASST
ncbi:HNH endonuclease signature motif containing protein [Actinomadura litoris]|uniref:HNH nuclease domain-containing protein n=1 Tax=Actinomadura litoris TaxID=2678616 RepID=A0A7K1LAQ0_9ACTN|nr:HNH endonuclease signature motif containing protein [Actinomadura litoris]MUN41494.1 hypothetical protein [Actinomadura litoris]